MEKHDLKVTLRNPPLQKVRDNCRTLKISDAFAALTYAYYKVTYKGEEILRYS